MKLSREDSSQITLGPVISFEPVCIHTPGDAARNSQLHAQPPLGRPAVAANTSSRCKKRPAAAANTGGHIDQFGETLDLEPLRMKPIRRGADHIRVAREARLKKRRDEKEEKAAAEHQPVRAQLDTISRIVPAAGAAIGTEVLSAVGRKRKPTVGDFAVLSRGLHIRLKQRVSLGVNHSRLIATGARVLRH